MNLSAIFSKTGKGVQEASGKTSHLSRADRAVLAAIDGKTPLSKVQENFEKLAGPKFEALIQQLDKDGFIREVSSGAAAAPTARPAAPAPRSAPPPPPSGGGDDDMDFTQAIKLPPKAAAPAAPKAPPVDLAAAGRAEAERKAKDAQAMDYKTRQEAEVKAKAEADLKARAAQEARLKAEAESKARAEAEAKARAAAEAKGRADVEAKARGEAEAKARADADSKTRAEADAKVKAAREAAVRMATEAKAKAEADAKAKTDAAERDKARLEAELNAKLDAERKAREEAEKRASEAAERARKDLEEKSKRDAEELRQRLEAEMKAKLDAERKAREEEDRKRREEEDRRRKEEDERRAKEEAERRAKEDADRKKREEEDRKRREDDERRRKEDDERRAKEDAERKAREEEDRKRRKEEDERRAKEDAERKARDEAERKAKDDAERKAKDEAERRALEDTNRRLETERRAKEEAERKAKDEAERKARDDAERKAKDDAERKAKDDAERRAKEEADAKARAAAAAATSLPKIEAVAPPAPAAPAAGGGIGDSLLADLDSFGKREEEEQREKEEAERKAKEAAARKAKEDAERRAKEDAERKAKEEAEQRRKEEEEKRAREEAERKEREEEDRRKEEEAERKRKAKESQAAKQAEERAAKAAAAGKGAAKAGEEDDIGVSDADLDLDDLKRDQKIAAEKARKVAKEAPSIAVATGGRPKKWGKPAAIALFVLLIAGLGVLQVMPISTAEYEKAASEAMGVPVKIGSAHLSVITGIELKMEGVSIGSAVKIRSLRGSPDVGSLFGPRKSFSRVDLEGVSVTQEQLADALLGKVGGENLRIGRIGIKQLTLDGPLKVPALDVDATVAGDGTLQTVKLTGADKFSVTLTPRNGEIGFDISAGSFAVPFVPALSLSDFSMKGSANATGVTTSEFDGRVYDGVLKGSARIRWGANWNVEGEVRAIGLKAGVFAPTLVSEGRVEGRAAYSMAGSAPASLYENARLQGEFKIEKGVIGSFDLSRALQTGGASSGGRTVFNEMSGQGLYDKGTVQISNATVSAGAMNAGMSLNIDTGGGLSGRVVADVKTPSQTLRATLNISGKVQEPLIRK